MREPYYAGGGTPWDWPLFNGYGRPPHTTLTVGGFALSAGPNGVAIGTFAWVDPDTGEVSNTQIPNGPMGFVLPVVRIWDPMEATSTRINGFLQRVIRPGLACVLAATGDFETLFPAGASAGSQVFTDPSTGLPYTFNPGSYVPTPWTACRDSAPLSRGRMSTSIKPFN